MTDPAYSEQASTGLLIRCSIADLGVDSSSNRFGRTSWRLHSMMVVISFSFSIKTNGAENNATNHGEE
jgi:hypothetical protein